MFILDFNDIAHLIKLNKFSNTILGIRNEIYKDFSNWNDFDKIPRIATHSKDGVIELMPISTDDNYIFKFVNGHPTNINYNLPTVMAFGVLAEVKTGIPLLISDMTIVTALRTAATSVIVAQLVARTNCISMAIIGNGAQSEFQALAFYYLMGIKTFRLYDIDKYATEKLVNNLKDFSDINTIICYSAKEACLDVDIITTITADKMNATIIDINMITRGQHINAVGGDCPGKTELSKIILENATVFTEYTEQTRLEGEIQQMPSDFKVIELHNIIKNKYIRKIDEITVFDSVGFAIEDYSGLNYFFRLANKYKVGQEINLIPNQENPKDLYKIIK